MEVMVVEEEEVEVDVMVAEEEEVAEEVVVACYLRDTAKLGRRRRRGERRWCEGRGAQHRRREQRRAPSLDGSGEHRGGGS